jgi:hypothetical protein
VGGKKEFVLVDSAACSTKGLATERPVLAEGLNVLDIARGRRGFMWPLIDGEEVILLMEDMLSLFLRSKGVPTGSSPHDSSLDLWLPSVFTELAEILRARFRVNVPSRSSEARPWRVGGRFRA